MVEQLCWCVQRTRGATGDPTAAAQPIPVQRGWLWQGGTPGWHTVGGGGGGR